MGREMQEICDEKVVRKHRLNYKSVIRLQVLGEILILAGFFEFSEKKLDKLTIYSYNKANFR